MIGMRRTSTAFAALVFSAVAFAASAQELRMSTVVDNMIGANGEAPSARLLFSQDEGKLCVVIAIVTGPSALRAPLFRFMHRTEGEERPTRLKFKLPGKPEKSVLHGDRIHVWQGCLPDVADADAAGTTIALEYRDARLLRQPAGYFVHFPTPEHPRGVDVLKDSAGNILFREFDPNSEQPG
jgi:hypothetical protein